jgi:hypothetical protein
MSTLWAFNPATLVILNQPPHEVVLHYQQLFQADWRVQWWRWDITMWILAMPMFGRSLRDVEGQFLGSRCMHHLP